MVISNGIEGKTLVQPLLNQVQLFKLHHCHNCSLFIRQTEPVSAFLRENAINKICLRKSGLGIRWQLLGFKSVILTRANINGFFLDNFTITNPLRAACQGTL